MTRNAPEKVFRIGYVSASVFVNEVKGENGTREVRNVQLQRRYKDGGEWKSSASFGVADLPLALRVLTLAQQHVEAAAADTEQAPAF